MKRQALAFAGVIGVAVLATMAPRSAPAQDRLRTSLDREAWEYAELRIVGNDAVIITRGDAQFLEGLDDREARQFVKLNNDRLRVRQPARVRHLTRVGSQGWEVIEAIPGGPNEAYLMKRRYKVEDALPAP